MKTHSLGSKNMEPMDKVGQWWGADTEKMKDILWAQFLIRKIRKFITQHKDWGLTMASEEKNVVKEIKDTLLILC